MRSTAFFVTILAIAVTLSGCFGSQIRSGNSQETGSLQVLVENPFYSGDSVGAMSNPSIPLSSLIVTVSKGDMIHTSDNDLGDLQDDDIIIDFPDLEPGAWDIVAEVLNVDNAVTYRATNSNVIIQPAKSTTTRMILKGVSSKVTTEVDVQSLILSGWEIGTITLDWHHVDGSAEGKTGSEILELEPGSNSVSWQYVLDEEAQPAGSFLVRATVRDITGETVIWQTDDWNHTNIFPGEHRVVSFTSPSDPGQMDVDIRWYPYLDPPTIESIEVDFSNNHLLFHCTPPASGQADDYQVYYHDPAASPDNYTFSRLTSGSVHCGETGVLSSISIQEEWKHRTIHFALASISSSGYGPMSKIVPIEVKTQSP